MLLYCPDQMLAVMLLSQHRVSSSKTVRSRALCGAWCMGHATRTWSAVCSAAPHSHFDEGADICAGQMESPNTSCQAVELNEAARNKPIPTDLVPALGTRTSSPEDFLQYSVFYLWIIHSEARMPCPARLSKRFHSSSTNGRPDLSLSWRVSKDPLKRPYKIWSGSRDLRWA